VTNEISSLIPFLSVVIPAYNERSTIALVVGKLLEMPFVVEIVIIDDCSTDGTSEICEALAEDNRKIRLVRHSRNRGKTEALKTGFALTTGSVVIVQDADLEYDPSEIGHVIQPILEGRADVVYGSRFMIKKAARVLYYYHSVANKFLTAMSNMLTNLNMSDVESGYKAFRGDIIRNMIITSSGFGFEIEVTAKIAKLKCAVYEVPISYYGRTYEEGKKISSRDAIQAAWLVLRFNLFCSLNSSFAELPQLRTVPTVSPLVTPDSAKTAPLLPSGHG
jgi:glycosyltransferase involved in cell wall biosynthesis